MTCSIKHNIHITNIADNAIVSYPLLLVKGEITAPCSHATQLLVANKSTAFSGTFTISTANKQFKCLVLLANGPNHVALKYCNSNKVIVVSSNQVAPGPNHHLLKAIYVICDGHDGHFQSPFAENSTVDACNKISLAMKLVQCLYAEKMHEKGFGRKSFELHSDCVLFHSTLTLNDARQMNQQELWHRIGREIVASKWGKEHRWKFVAFLGCTRFEGIDNGDYSHKNVQEHTKANAALGGGDLALFGTGCLYTWPSTLDEVIDHFQDIRHIDVAHFMDDSNNRRTFGGCFATTLGSLCHEIGHVFSLGHTANGIMGDGFDYINRVFTVDNLTENLPARIVAPVGAAVTEAKRIDTRLTNMKRSNSFLLKYQEQKGDSDATYFAENSAVVLAHHKWFNGQCEETDVGNVITFEINDRIVRSQKVPLRLVELRQKITALAKQYFIIKERLSFCIPQDVDLKNCDLFVMDDHGHSEVFTEI